MLLRSLVVVMAVSGTAAAAPAITSTTRIAGTAGTKGSLGGKPVRQATLASGGALQLHVLEDSQLAIAMRDKAGAWMTWQRPDLALLANDCGIGRCEEVESVVVARAKDVVYFHLRVRAGAARATDATRRHDIVIGCKTNATLTCAAVETTRDWTTSAFISGTTVTTRYSVAGRLHVETHKLAL
jgi:hypothetical protein